MSAFEPPPLDIEVTLPTPADFSTALAEGFARRMGVLARRLGGNAASVRWAQRAAFAVSRATSEGHVCVPLDVLAARYETPQAEVRAALAASGIACDGSAEAQALRPLVVDAQGRVFLARYYEHERQLARALVAHAGGDDGPSTSAMHGVAQDVDALRARLLRYFGPPRDDELDWQRVAAVMALSGRLTIVSGGPGTGKTTTVVGVLACLLDASPDLRIALAAPTGKAAQRMQEALLARAGDLPPEIAARLPQTSSTLHRLLGSGPGGRFRHHRDNPLPFDVIVIDEASMIDVAMAAHLLDAIAPRTRLVMLGDKDQLAAVEAGAVFAELSARPAFSAEGIARVAAALDIGVAQLAAALPSAASGAAVPSVMSNTLNVLNAPNLSNTPNTSNAEGSAPTLFDDDLAGMTSYEEGRPPASPATARTGEPLADAVVWLERNYRFGLDSAIGRLSLAIRGGDPQAVLDTLTPNPDAPCAAALFEDASPALSGRTVARLAAGFAPYAEALANALAARVPDPAPLFEALNRFRILCSTRSGLRGVEQVNTLMAAQVRRMARIPSTVGAGWFAGRPVMVTRNDYALGLFNGDIGIALPGADGALRVYFWTGDGSSRAVSPAALPPHDTAFALTVHKSQGSEFGHAALVLPTTFSRVLSRELVYTAITRARERVEVIGSRAVLAQAIAAPTQRDSGLAARIEEAMARDA